MVLAASPATAMFMDLRLALRRLVRSPGFSAVVVLTLALGIGATTAIFSLVEAVLLRPLDYPEPQRIVTLWSFSMRRQQTYKVSGPDFRDWQTRSRSFSTLARYAPDQSAVMAGGLAETVGVAHVSAGFFEALGVGPRLGRPFSDEELRTGSAVVVGDAFARRHFSGQPERALGAPLRSGGYTFTIVAVMPPGFAFPARAEVWAPIDTVAPASPARTAHNYHVLGRLRPEVSLAQAQAEMDGIAAALAREYPDANGNKGARVIALSDLLVGEHRTTLWILLGAVGLVLLIACANIANLLLARGARRSHEMAVRVALGAGRGRIARQLLAESVLLAAAGGAAGVLVAGWGLDALLALAPPGIPRLEQVSVDRWALLFSGAVTVAVCLLIGAFPVAQAVRLRLVSALHAGGRSVSVARGRLRSALVVAQLAISLVLLASAGLLMRSLDRLVSVDPGYRLEKLLVMEADFTAGTEETARRRAAFFQELQRRAAVLPGVTAASYGHALPLDRASSNGSYEIEGRPRLAFSESGRRSAIFRLVGAGYFSTLGIPVRAGREIDSRDVPGAPATVLINETMARALVAWPSESPLGLRIRFGWYKGTMEWLTIAGVVADTRQQSLAAPITQELYVPAAQHPRLAPRKLFARTAGEPLALADSLRRAARAFDAEVPVSFSTADLLVRDSLAAPRFRALLIGLFAAVALLLAVVGMVGVMAYVVAERRTEIGIRMAIGATSAGILREFLARSLRLTLLGLALGLAGALAAARLLRGLLYGVSASDPSTLALVSALLVTAALAAAAWPALRASRESPLTALRDE
jgi:putative ABC transport system permease protein